MKQIIDLQLHFGQEDMMGTQIRKAALEYGQSLK
jgi:hypothetical protein